jgi:hypothetical protein
MRSVTSARGDTASVGVAPRAFAFLAAVGMARNFIWSRLAATGDSCWQQAEYPNRSSSAAFSRSRISTRLRSSRDMPWRIAIYNTTTVMLCCMAR